jgi:hypothetical protein
LEIAIKIIKRFMEMYRQSSVVLRQLSGFVQTTYQRPEDRFLEMFLKQQQQQFGNVPSQSEELTEEEKERLRKLKEKMIQGGQ